MSTDLLGLRREGHRATAALRFGLTLSALLMLLAPGCTGDKTPSASDPAGDAPFTDPFAYCAAVEDIDAPDQRYAGDAVPQTVLDGIREASGASTEAPDGFFMQGTSWRCMAGEVYACLVGANLPCQAKADTSDEPSSAMDEFCGASPGADVIPAAVTGRETVYAWSCDGDHAVVERQLFEVDERGFIADFWYRLESSGS